MWCHVFRVGAHAANWITSAIAHREVDKSFWSNIHFGQAQLRKRCSEVVKSTFCWNSTAEHVVSSHWFITSEERSCQRGWSSLAIGDEENGSILLPFFIKRHRLKLFPRSVCDVKLNFHFAKVSLIFPLIQKPRKVVEFCCLCRVYRRNLCLPSDVNLIVNVKIRNDLLFSGKFEECQVKFESVGDVDRWGIKAGCELCFVLSVGVSLKKAWNKRIKRKFLLVKRKNYHSK